LFAEEEFIMDGVFSNPQLSDKIKQYWCDRASATEPTSLQATTYDVFLRELEISTVKEKIAAACLPPGAAVVDLGCGDGYSTASLAASFPAIRFIGVDWSAEMLALARQRASAQGSPPDMVSFRVGDMRNLSASLQSEKFEAFLTMRSLINLTTSEEQYGTITQIAERLAPGGYYFGIENFMQGQNNFNRMRVAVGLPEIPVRWHNHFFEEETFMAETAKLFDSVAIESFSSSYYLATRVIYSAGCYLEGVEPDYFHPIHRTAGRLPAFGDFSPIKLVCARRKL
jgi:SAM-dependent methyltransferase